MGGGCGGGEKVVSKTDKEPKRKRFNFGENPSDD